MVYVNPSHFFIYSIGIMVKTLLYFRSSLESCLDSYIKLHIGCCQDTTFCHEIVHELARIMLNMRLSNFVLTPFTALVKEWTVSVRI